jgi:SOS-response transcriptional repressor LexA
MRTVVDPTLRPAYVWVYRAIHEAITEHGISPTKGEITRAVGCSSTTVINAVRELKARGFITETKYEARSIRLVDPEVMVRREPLPPWEEDLNIPKLWATAD